MAFVENGGVFTSEAALLPDFVPEEPLHRERQLSEIATALKPALKSMQCDNLFMYGPTGSGKTTSAKHVAKQLNEHRPKVNCVYINCWEHNTRLSVLSEIAGGIDIGFPRRGLAGDEVFSRIVEMSEKNNSAIIVFLDEFDQLVLKKEVSVVYDLSRASENHGVNVGIVGISNNANLLETLDPRIKSSFSAKKVQFPRYTPTELKDILRERAKLSFRPNSWGEEVIALCAGHAAKLGGDCRVALRCLWRAARNAEATGNKITEVHVRQAFEEKQEAISEITNEVEKKIVQLLSKPENASGVTSGELYEALGKTASERSLRSYVSLLSQRGVIEVSDVYGKEAGGKGKSRIVKLGKK